MRRLKLFIVLGFGIMFVAGLEVGRSHTTVSSLKDEWKRVVSTVTGKPEPAPATQPVKPDSHHLLFGVIELTPSQDEQIHKIYRDAHTHTDTLGHQFRDFDRERDEQIVAILDPLQKMEYDEIQRDRDERIGELRTEIGMAMDKAGKDVRAILTADQQKQYDDVKKKFVDHGHRGGTGGAPWRGGPGQGGRRPHIGSPESQPGAGPETSPSAP